MPASEARTQHVNHLACYGQALGGRPVRVRVHNLPDAASQEVSFTQAGRLPHLSLTEEGVADLWLHAPDENCPPSSLLAGVPVVANTKSHHQWHTPSKLAWATTAHAAAHLQHGQAAQARASLKPLQIALLALLEDARVEHAMLRDCPGLRDLWVPLHTVTYVNSHNGFESLLARLSLSLLNPAYVDPHPWITRVRAHLLGAEGQGFKVGTFEGLRVLASVLGHEIGQMRLPFDARTYQGVTPYRDDNQHLWLPDEGDAAATPPDADVVPNPGSDVPVDTAPLVGPVFYYPEWDQRIGRMRPDWCRVVVREVPKFPDTLCHAAPGARRLARTLGLQQAGSRVSAGRSEEGQRLHPMASVDAQLDRLRGLTPDWRVFYAEQQAPQPLAVWLLLDTSLSMGAKAADVHALAWRAMTALDMLGHRTALWALSSDGRHEVGMTCLKGWADCLPDAHQTAVTCAGSSRLGAGVRHGLAEHAKDAQNHQGWRRLVVIVTDGELHDIDVHDPTYLYGDLAHCRAEAVHMQVSLRGLLNTPDKARRFRTVVGADNCAVATSERGLQDVLKRLLAK